VGRIVVCVDAAAEESTIKMSSRVRNTPNPEPPKTAPPSYRYFVDMVAKLAKVQPADLTENSVLLGSPARIADTLKKVEAAGFDEVILYFNVGQKPHGQVKDEMARFMAEVAPAFAGARKEAAA